jgi:hypothetical protein
VSDELVCAACAGRVSEGRCPTCRSARDELAAGRPPAELFLLGALAAAVLLVLLLLTA